jgi:hypothetical protein
MMSIDRGEFVEDRVTVQLLNSKDLIRLRDEGVYEEPPEEDGKVDDSLVMMGRAMMSGHKKQQEEVR